MYKPTDFSFRTSKPRIFHSAPAGTFGHEIRAAAEQAVSNIGRACAPGQDCAAVHIHGLERCVTFWDSKANTRSSVDVWQPWRVQGVALSGPRTVMSWARETGYWGSIGPWQRRWDNKWFNALYVLPMDDDHLFVRNDAMVAGNYFEGWKNWQFLREESLLPK